MRGINWIYNNKPVVSLKDVPEGVIGIIYRIDNLSNGKFYVGRKTILSVRKLKATKKFKAIKGNARKRFMRIIKETDWKSYTGSCEPLLVDIEKGDKIKKTIVRYCYNKKQLSYYEMKEIICSDCLLIENCYNANLLGRFFPKDLI